MNLDKPEYLVYSKESQQNDFDTDKKIVVSENGEEEGLLVELLKVNLQTKETSYYRAATPIITVQTQPGHLRLSGNERKNVWKIALAFI